MESVGACEERNPLLEMLDGFAKALRRAGLPVSLTERIDALEAIRRTDISDREALKNALGATLVKTQAHWPTFEVLFDVFFSIREGPCEGIDDTWLDELAVADSVIARDGRPPAQSEAELAEMLMAALAAGDLGMLAALARGAVGRYAGMQPGRPVGGTYYLYRTMRNLRLEEMIDELMAGSEAQTPLEIRLEREEFEDRAEMLRREIEAVIRRRLVADRGHEALARTLSKPLPEDVEFIHASRDELEQIRRAVVPLTRKLAARLSRRRRQRDRGHLDYRRTFRDSLGFGGVPVEPKFRRPRPSKPEIVIIADISGSVAAFARFTLHFMYAINSNFSKVRSFVFIDGVDEVTHLFENSDDMETSIMRINTEADVVWVDGHSDYGHALGAFRDRYGKAVGTRTSVLILGDGRNNYHASGAEALEKLHRRSRRLFWLNPEPRSYWNSGDSIMAEYRPHCDGVFEVRTLRQLERFVEQTF